MLKERMLALLSVARPKLSLEEYNYWLDILKSSDDVGPQQFETFVTLISRRINVHELSLGQDTKPV